MADNNIITGIFAGLVLLFCIGGVHGAVITVNELLPPTGVPGEHNFVVSLDEAPAGIAGYKIKVELENKGAVITDVRFETALWGLNSFEPDLSPTPPSSVTIAAVDLQKKVEAGSTNIELFQLTIASDGSSNQIILDVREITDDRGDSLPKPTIEGGRIGIPVPKPTGTATPTGTVVPTATTAPTGTVPTTSTTAPISGQLVASFTSDKTFGTAPLTIHFKDASTGKPEKYFWDFGDGKGASVIQNPQYTYRKPGVYTVTLTVFRGQEASTTTSTTDILIGAPRSIPVPRVNGILSIGSIPQGADIYVNGAHYGKTPIRIEDLTPHTYQVRLKMPGYYDSVLTIPILAGPMPSYAAAVLLKPVPPNVGSIVARPDRTGSAYIVTYPEGADVYLEGVNVSSDGLDVYFEGNDALIQNPLTGEKVGTTDLMITKLPVGTYNLTLKREGFADWVGQIEIRVGKTVMQVYHYDHPTYERVASEYFNEPDIAEGAIE